MRSTRMGSETFPACGSFGRNRFGSRELGDMLDGSKTIKRVARKRRPGKRPPGACCSRWPVLCDLPEFMMPKSMHHVRELARMIVLADWAPRCYRDIEGNYVQQKIELAIMHG